MKQNTSFEGYVASAIVGRIELSSKDRSWPPPISRSRSSFMTKRRKRRVDCIFLCYPLIVEFPKAFRKLSRLAIVSFTFPLGSRGATCSNIPRIPKDFSPWISDQSKELGMGVIHTDQPCHLLFNDRDERRPIRCCRKRTHNANDRGRQTRRLFQHRAKGVCV